LPSLYKRSDNVEFADTLSHAKAYKAVERKRFPNKNSVVKGGGQAMVDIRSDKVRCPFTKQATWVQKDM